MAKGQGRFDSRIAETVTGIWLPDGTSPDTATGKGPGESANAFPRMARGKGPNAAGFAMIAPGSGRSLPHGVGDNLVMRCADVLPEALRDSGDGLPAFKLVLDCVIRSSWLQPGGWARIGSSRDFSFEILHVGARDGWAFVSRMVGEYDAMIMMGWVRVERLQPLVGHLGGIAGARIIVLYAGEPGTPFAGSLYARRPQTGAEGWIQSTRVQWAGDAACTGHVALARNTSLRVGCTAKAYRDWSFPIPEDKSYLSVGAGSLVTVLHIGHGADAGWVVVGQKIKGSSKEQPEYTTIGWLPTTLVHVVPQRGDFAEHRMIALQMSAVADDGYAWLLAQRQRSDQTTIHERERKWQDDTKHAGDEPYAATDGEGAPYAQDTDPAKDEPNAEYAQKDKRDGTQRGYDVTG